MRRPAPAPAGLTVLMVTALLAIAVRPALAAGSDNLAGAAVIAGLPLVNDATNNATATREAGEFGVCGSFPATANTRSLWYRYTAAGAGWLTAHTRGSTYDTVLEVYTSTVGSPTAGQLVSLACNDDLDAKTPVRQSQVQIAVSAGVTYYFVIRSYGASEAVGTASFSASFATDQNLYVALTGDDNNVGAVDAPLRTLQRAVTLASSAGDAVITALDAGPYGSTILDKSLRLMGTGTTAGALTLSNNAQLVAGSSGLTAPDVTVNAGSRAQDGLTLAAAGGVVSLGAGTFAEALTISRSVTLQSLSPSARAVIDPPGGDGVLVTAGAAVTLSALDIQGAVNGVRVTGGAVSLLENNFAGNTVAVTATVAVNAVRNYWGSATGPDHSGNPGGAGQPVGDNVAYSPWCTNPAPACDPVRGPLAALAFTTPPGNTQATLNITPAMVVEARDTFGNRITGYTGVITLSLGANPGAGALSGAASQAAVAGQATFAGLSINNPGVGYTLVASTAAPGGGVITATSAAFNIFNAAPAAANDTATVLEDASAATLNVLANDNDPNGDALQITGLIQPANGLVSVVAGPAIAYTPAADFFGADVFTYTIDDVYGSGVATATVTVTVTGVNDAPTYNLKPSATVVEDAGAFTDASFATAIAAGPNETGQSVTFSLTNTNTSLFAAQPALSAGGQLTFTPAADAFGSATVYVTAQDNGGTANGGQDTAAVRTFVVMVDAVNDAPSFSLPTTVVTVTEDSGLYGPAGFAAALSAGPANEAGQALGFNLSASAPLSFAVAPTLSPAGALAFQPAPDAFGTITVTATLQDDGGTANGGQDTSPAQTFWIVITPLPDAPVAGPDAAAIAEDAALLNFNPLPNDIDVDQEALTVSAVGSTPAGLTSFTASALAFTPTADFTGQAVFTYTVSDPTARTSTAAVTVTVTAVNDPPQFSVTSPTVPLLEDSGAHSQTVISGARPGPVTAGDEAGQALAFQVSHSFPLSFTVQPALALSGTQGVLSFTPAPDVFGTVVLGVTLQDDGGGLDTSASQPITLTLTPVNDAPDFANGGDRTAAEDAGPQTVAGWAAPLNPGPYEAGQALAFTVTNTNNSLFTAQPAVNAAGDLTFTPAAEANGVAQVFVRATDDGGTANGGQDQSGLKTFTLTIGAVNDPPSFTLASTTLTVTEDFGAFTAAGFASSLRPGPLAAVDEAGQALSFLVTHGASALFAAGPALSSATGDLTFTPAPNANGSATITIRLQDDGGTAGGGQDTSAAQTLTIVITPVADAPLAAGDAYTVTEDSVGNALLVLDNDDSVDGGSLSILSFTPPANGSAAGGPPIAYTPAADYFGADALTYVVTDTASGLTATAGVALTVLPVNDAPSFTKGVDITRTEDSPAVTFLNWATNLVAGPANEAGQSVSLVITNSAPALFAQQPAVNPADGGLTFAPAPNAFGAATVTLQARDDGGAALGGQDTSAPQTFVITLTPVNDPPTPADDHLSVLEDSADNNLAVLANDSGAPDAGETLTVLAAGPAVSGTVSVAPGGGAVLYTPPAGFAGVDTFTYTVSDGNGGTAQAAVTVTVGSPARRVYLPALARDFAARPDLVGAFSLNPANPAAGQPVLITAVITNQGVASSGGFWVDFYINPNPPPDAANQPWDQRCGLTPCLGIAWFVPGPLAPGASVTLDSTAGSVFDRNTVWFGSLPAGVNALYLYVDSWNCDADTKVCVPEGAVPESDETNNRSARTGLGPLEEAAGGSAPVAPFSLDLPSRPARPDDPGE